MTAKKFRNPRDNFISLLGKIDPTDSELTKAESFSSSCESRLNKSFDVVRFIPIGSHSRGAAIRHFSDLDYLAVLTKSEAKWGGKIVNSNTLINRVSDQLKDRFTKTEIRKDCQAIVINFGSGQNSMDIVPAFFREIKDKRPIYQIPNGDGGWMLSSPEAHNMFIQKQNVKSGGKLVKVGRILRYWKRCRTSTVSVSSFYIDLILAESNVCSGIKSYPEVIYEFFEHMDKRKCRGLHDPIDVAGAIYAVQTSAQADALKRIINDCHLRAYKALIAEQSGDFQLANSYWNTVFNQNFLS